MDEQLDDALKRLLVWVPPAEFASRVGAVAVTQVESARCPSRRRVWAWNVVQGVAAAGLAWAVGVGAWWIVDPYVRMMTVATDVMIMKPVAVSWTCAALSLIVAAVTTRRALV